MELKYYDEATVNRLLKLLIVLNGIEMKIGFRKSNLKKLLIVLNGIEIEERLEESRLSLLLIVLNGIEIKECANGL